MHLIQRTRRFAAALAGLTTGPIFQRGATVKAGRRRSFRARLAAAALAIPALTVASGSVMAATAARAAAHQVHQDRSDVGQAVTAGISAAGTASRTVLAWGRNTTGQLGDGTTTSASTPVKVHLPAGTKVTQVRAGCAHTLALTAMGHVLAWGSDSDGQLGDGRVTDSAIPVRVKLPRGTKITAIRAGCVHSLALTSKGQVLAWGYNHGGELGNGSTANSDVPVRVRLPRHAKVTAVSAGQYFSLARTAKGQVLAWGDNDSGELGNGSTASSDVPVRVALPAGVRATAVSAEEETSLARTSGGGGLLGWGDNSLGQMGDGTTTGSDTPVSIPILLRGPSLGHLVSLFGGCGHTVALFSSGKVLAWGSNVFGQLGDGTTTGSDTPVVVILPASTKVTAISAGCATSYALTRSGHMLAWGLGAIGELGDGSTSSSDTPVRVGLPSGWRAFAVGSGPMAAHALAIVHKKA
jgi:alpha-tubulin suppressor-like RCC1 family protein